VGKRSDLRPCTADTKTEAAAAYDERLHRIDTRPQGPTGPKSSDLIKNLIESSQFNFSSSATSLTQGQQQELEPQIRGEEEQHISAAAELGAELNDTDTEITNNITFLLGNLSELNILEADKMPVKELLEKTENQLLEKLKRWSPPHMEITLKALHLLIILLRNLSEKLKTEIKHRRNHEMLSP
jgi:hypothetical protein